MMKELLKKASLTVATACLVAGGLVSVGLADNPTSMDRSPARVIIVDGQVDVDAGYQPHEMVVNGVRYVRANGRCPRGECSCLPAGAVHPLCP